MLALVDDLSKNASESGTKIVPATDLFRYNGTNCYSFKPPKSKSLTHKNEEFGLLKVGEDGIELIVRHRIIALSGKFSK